MKAILISLVVGALAVSTAEYFFHYNLVDLVKDKLVSIVDHIKSVYHALRGK